MIYNIPDGWKKTTLNTIGKIVGGGTPSTKVKEYYDNGTIPWLTPKDLSNYNKKYISKGERNITELGLQKSSAKLYPKGTVIFSSRAPIGYVAIASNDVSTNQGFKSIIPNCNVTTSDFVYYLLKYNTDKIKNVGSGSTFAEVSGKVMKEFEILLPTYKDQIAIANLLSSFDDKIENNNAIIANLEEQAQTIFKSWIVDFELFLERGYTHSDVGNIPKNWEVNTLEKISEIIDNRGKTPPLSSEQTNFPIIDVATLKSSNRLIDYGKATKYVDSTIYKTWFRSGHPQYGDILLSTVGSIGHCKLYLKDLGTIAQNVVAFRFDKDLILFMYQWFKYNHLTLVSYNIGSVQPSIKVTQINKIKLAIPSKEVLKDFNEIINPVNDLIEKLDTQNQKLVLMRDLLLPKLMSGEIRVGDVDTVE
ncbi:restriction endonuclease subunit S [Fundicoccus sp. Sow4_D5]|uniref:restriction endonuclease subunit S n=1 Tax=Fundicoccus sp. Sow4_D5 TaxID=3438782 RepID=UPI003F8DAC31